MLGNYVLDGHKPVLCPDPIMWGKWFERGERKVAHTIISDSTYVSTVFLGIDHSFGNGPPLLFETMAFGRYTDEGHRRYATWDEAEEGHKKVCSDLLLKIG